VKGCTKYSIRILFGPNSRLNSVFAKNTPNTNNSDCTAAARLIQREASKANSAESQTY